MVKKDIRDEIVEIIEVNRIISFFYTLVTLYAVYLCLKRNNGISWCIFPALLLSPFYIVYVFATKDKNFKMNPFR